MDAGLRTPRLLALPVGGEAISSADGLQASFSLATRGNEMSDLRFHCSSCTTLIAYCEALRRLCRGTELAAAGQFGAADLVAVLPGVPAARQNRAALAVAALRAALVAAEHTTEEKEIQG